MSGHPKTCDWTQVTGKSIFWAGFQFAIASVQMSSTFSVINFSTDKETLQNAATSLQHYVIIGMVWTVATMLVMYSKHGVCGLVIGFLANAVIVGWLIGTYIHAFRTASKKYHLPFPSLFSW
jgi:hypothetical protein